VPSSKVDYYGDELNEDQIRETGKFNLYSSNPQYDWTNYHQDRPSSRGKNIELRTDYDYELGNGASLNLANRVNHKNIETNPALLQ
jgi:hypothetical protein